MYHPLHLWHQIQDVHHYNKISATPECRLNEIVTQHHQMQHDRLEDQVYGVESNHYEIEYVVLPDE